MYQQTYLDTDCNYAIAKRYTNKTPLMAADLLNDRVLPFYNANMRYHSEFYQVAFRKKVYASLESL